MTGRKLSTQAVGVKQAVCDESTGIHSISLVRLQFYVTRANRLSVSAAHTR
jgi:hypothetical protein